MSLTHCHTTGLTRGAPNALWKLLLEVRFDAAANVVDLGRDQQRLAEQIIEAVEASAADFDAQVDLFDETALVRCSPVFPLVHDGWTAPSHLDIVELVERTCANAPLLNQTFFDVTGRAFDVVVDVTYQQRPELDRMRFPTERFRAAEPRPSPAARPIGMDG
jgi:hypothetical protein